jgi:hypothetical protein
MPIHRREVWDRICNGESGPNGNGNGNGNGFAAAKPRPTAINGQIEIGRRQ